MGRIGRIAGFLLAALVVLVVAAWSTPADAHAAHGARAGQDLSQPAVPEPSFAAVQPVRDPGAAHGCALECCVGGATCVAHVAAPPMSGPELPDPGSMRFLPTAEPDLPGIDGERLPRPPRGG